MKRSMLVIVVILLAIAGMMMGCAGTGGTQSTSRAAAPAAAAAPSGTGDLGAFRARMEDNFQYGTAYQAVISNSKLLGGAKFVAGETYTLKVTYSASRDMEDKMQIILVDTTEKGNWWTELTENSEATQIPASKAGEVVSATITFKTIADASGNSGPANAVVFLTDGEGVSGRAGSGVQKSFNLEFTEFVLTKVE